MRASEARRCELVLQSTRNSYSLVLYSHSYLLTFRPTLIQNPIQSISLLPAHFRKLAPSCSTARDCPSRAKRFVSVRKMPYDLTSVDVGQSAATVDLAVRAVCSRRVCVCAFNAQPDSCAMTRPVRIGRPPREIEGVVEPYVQRRSIL